MLPLQPFIAGRGSGASNPVSFEDEDVSAGSEYPATANAVYRLNSDGTIYTDPDTTANGTNWLNGGSAADFECRATEVAGSVSGGSGVGTWLALSSNRLWNASRLGIGEKQVVLTVEIRRASDSVVVDSATITLTAMVVEV